ncbi:MAG: hypothetical protein KBS69_03085 [Bacteroidales bacterium]|nr:hypothetical protein [Candidatus Colicola caccequi]
MRQFYMYEILRALEAELGEGAFSVYEWYCKTYSVGAEDIAPSIVAFEVLGEG